MLYKFIACGPQIVKLKKSNMVHSSVEFAHSQQMTQLILDTW